MHAGQYRADGTPFILHPLEVDGELIEHSPTTEIFTTPRDDRTEQYVTGKFG
jgi:phosphate transport system ATP-binding protein